MMQACLLSSTNSVYMIVCVSVCVHVCVCVCVCINKTIIKNKVWEWSCPLSLMHRLVYTCMHS